MNIVFIISYFKKLKENKNIICIYLTNVGKFKKKKQCVFKSFI